MSKNIQIPSDLLSILDPTASTKQLVGRWDKSGYSLPLFVVGVTVAVNLVSAIQGARWVASGIEGSAIGVYLVSAVSAVVVPVVIWLGVGVGLHFLAVLAGLDTDLRHVIWMTGVGLAPYAVSSIISGGASLVVLADVAAPQTASAVQTQSLQLQARPIVRIANLTHLGFLVWCGAEWTDMGRSVWETTTRKAAKVVAAPTLFLIAVYMLTTPL